MSTKYPFYGHDDGLVIDGPDTGFASRPMTPAELAARDAALAISRDIYRHACHAGVCYHEIWQLIAAAAQSAIDAQINPLTQQETADLHNFIEELQDRGLACDVFTLGRLAELTGNERATLVRECLAQWKRSSPSITAK